MRRSLEVSNNEVIRSYEKRTVQMINMVEEMQQHITLRDVTFTPVITQNLICIAHARKNRFIVRVEDDLSNTTQGAWIYIISHRAL